MINKEIDGLSDEILKTAGFISSAGKAIGRTVGGATLGAGIGSLKGVSANEANPNASADEKMNNVFGGVAGGAVLGGLAAGPGIAYAKHVGKGVSNGVKNGFKSVKNGVGNLFKHSEMEIPKGEIEKSDDDENVRESPNESEKRKMVNSITDNDEKKQYYKDQIQKEASLMLQNFFKQAGYMKDIDCEQCGYSGSPNSEDGRCPVCGAMGGIKPHETPGANNNEPLNRELMEGEFQRVVDQDSRESIMHY